MPNHDHLPYQLIAIVGPTASGKTALAIELADRLGSEVISADSMQVYRGMAIGTSAPTPEDLARCRHHFIGILEPDESYSAGAFSERACPMVAALNDRGVPAVVAGGSGLYVQALIDGLFAGPGRDDAIRERLHAEAEQEGPDPLYARLQEVDPDYAESIHPGDLRRIVRGLEVHEATGDPISHLHRTQRAESEPLHALQIAIDHPRETLYDRINRRVEQMLEQGFVDEVRTLMRRGYLGQIERLRTLGYREFAAYLLGRQTYEEAVEAMKQNTRRFAKRQLTWFRADPRIEWMPAPDDGNVTSLAEDILARL